MIQINPDLDIETLAATYKRNNRIQVRNILTDASAKRILHCLRTEVPWGFAYYKDNAAQFLQAKDLAQLSPQEQHALTQDVYQGARSGYQYAYSCYPMLDAYLGRWNPHLLLDRLLEFINSEDMLAFIRQLIGVPTIRKGDAQATRYGPNQFLKQHTDENVGEEWRAAYVLNLTPHWEADWGGFLQFFDEDNNVKEALIPRFNALNVFTVPQSHAVSFIANYATEHRYSITGWFRDN